MRWTPTLQKLWRRNKSEPTVLLVVGCPRPVPQCDSSAPALAHSPELGTGGRMREKETGFFFCQKCFHFITVESHREEDFPEKPATASRATMPTSPDWYNQSEQKQNWTWQLRHVPGYSSGATSSQRLLLLHWLAIILLLLFLHLNENWTSRLSLLIKIPAAFQLLPHFFLLFWKSIWKDKLRLEQPHLT